ncbi:MAG: hypothetical protein HY791_33470 [Deltaproteobacteria bacterium]|nr:hypothetical protein [Deltaproteobacteria bacterium]
MIRLSSVAKGSLAFLVACGGVDDVDLSAIDRGTSSPDIHLSSNGSGSLTISAGSFAAGGREILLNLSGPSDGPLVDTDFDSIPDTPSCLGIDTLSDCWDATLGTPISFGSVCPGTYDLIDGSVYAPSGRGGPVAAAILGGCDPTLITGDTCLSTGPATVTGGLGGTLDIRCSVVTGALDLNIDCSNGC